MEEMQIKLEVLLNEFLEKEPYDKKGIKEISTLYRACTTILEVADIVDSPDLLEDLELVKEEKEVIEQSKKELNDLVISFNQNKNAFTNYLLPIAEELQQRILNIQNELNKTKRI